MKALIVNTAAVLVICTASTLASAQTAIQPGQVAAVTHPALLLPGGAPPLSSGSSPATTIAEVQDAREKATNRLWIGSMFAAVAATGFDAATSWGKAEGNPLLASGGTFGAKGAALKAGFAAALVTPQILLRKDRELKRVFMIGNFVEAGIFSALAVHNLGVKPPQ